LSLPSVLQKMTKIELFNLLNNTEPHEEAIGKEIKPLMILFSNEEFLNEEKGTIEEGIKTKIVTIDTVYEGFSWTLRKQCENLIMVFNNDLPTIKIKKELKGLKTAYKIEVIDDAREQSA